VERLKTIETADNQQKLKIYALYKQATVGKNTSSKPGMLDFVKKAKWDAWTSLGDMSKVIVNLHSNHIRPYSCSTRIWHIGMVDSVIISRSKFLG